MKYYKIGTIHDNIQRMKIYTECIMPEGCMLEYHLSHIIAAVILI